MKNNNEFIGQIFQQLLNFGVKDFIVCAGARNSPFVEFLRLHPEINSLHFFEERSAAFFALGRAQRDSLPVAVITTSGTAAAELLPAAIEAHYTQIPLILITADRPKRYRGKGAPQSIEQVGLFSHYVSNCIDLDIHSSDAWAVNWQKMGPIHLNVCLDEPLIDGPSQKKIEKTQSNLNLKKTSIYDLFLDHLNDDMILQFRESKPLIILGSLNEQDQEVVVKIINRLKIPCYIESLSGLHGVTDLNKQFVLKAGDRAISYFFKNGYFKSVIRLGGIPTLRFWRDLESSYSQVPVLNISSICFPGLAREEHVYNLIKIDNVIIKENVHHFINDVLVDIDKKKSTENQQGSDKIDLYDSNKMNFDILEIKKIDELAFEFKEKLYNEFPYSEQSYFFQLTHLSQNKQIYIGNSMPIRYWDLCHCYEGNASRVFGNRGANGIDGQISTYLGWIQNKNDSMAVVGDLTALYDLASLWPLDQMEINNAHLVIINNSGGQIFRPLLGQHKLFLNTHTINFENWAQMWNVKYQKVINSSLNFLKAESLQVIEVIPDITQTEKWHQAWEDWWKQKS